MKGKTVTLVLVCMFVEWLSGFVGAQDMHQYNVVWQGGSRHAGESMPCGGGDIGLNVWVEKGDVMIYMARSGSFDEHNGLLKAGRLRLRLTPAPFSEQSVVQTLHLESGYVTVKGAYGGKTTEVKVRVDVENPVVYVEITGNLKVEADLAYENWRFEERGLRQREGFGNSWKWVQPKNVGLAKDLVNHVSGGVRFVHHNPLETIFDTTVAAQHLNDYKSGIFNPIANLAFGGMILAEDWTASGTGSGVYAGTAFKSWHLKTSKPSTKTGFKVLFHRRQTDDIRVWEKELEQMAIRFGGERGDWEERNLTWWRDFWKRSYIHIESRQKGGDEWQIGRNYQLFRYMLAANSRGEWPTKFNGGLFTVDPVFTDTARAFSPDFRNWGGGLHTMQNQRLVYFPMFRSGDWDLLQPQFEFYLNLLKTAELRSWVYWGHEGACFTEQMENFGLPNLAEYGTKRPDDFDKGVEYNAWLEYHWDSVLEFCLMMLDEHRYTGKDIRSKVPFIRSCLRFFDEHYRYRARMRGRREFDGNGHLVLYPGSAAETYKMATNASSTIAALGVITHRLLALSDSVISENDRKELTAFSKRIPPVPLGVFSGKPTIAPAKLWERINNVESPQLYPVFPWGIYGVGKPDLDLALNTWQLDTNVVKFRSHVGWKQDNIWAARLGLAEEAWRLTKLKLGNSDRRFPSFWGPGFDWVPDHNWGGSGMVGLQEMLMQTDDRKIWLLPAWPKHLDVSFRMHAPYNTVVEAEWSDGKFQKLEVFPEERRKDVIVVPEGD